MSKRDIILLSASPNAGSGSAEGSDLQSDEDRGSDAWMEYHKKMEMLSSQADMRRNIFIGNNWFIV